MKITTGLADNMIKKRFGNLVILCVSKKRGKRNLKLIECICDCGNKRIATPSKIIRTTNPTCGKGVCKSKKNPNPYRNTLVRKWNSMMKRCYNKSNKDFKNYGGRSIKVNEEWKNVDNFVRDLSGSYGKLFEEGKRPIEITLDRIDVNKNYSRSNYRWVSNKTQQNNKTNNIFYKINNKKLTLAQICEKYRIKYCDAYRKLFINKQRITINSLIKE